LLKTFHTMKHIRFILFLVFIFTFNFSFSQESSFTHDCFSMLVGKQATSDGSVMFAHNEDDWGDRLVNWYKVPAMTHKEGTFVTLKNGGKLEQPKQTWSYVWLEMPEMDYSDSYMNEWGVTIGSDACLSKEKKPELTDGGIGYWLRRAMAERAKSAKEAVLIGGSLVEKYGYAASGRTYCIADENEAWMLSVVHGKHWVAQRVPDNHIAIIPNYYTITAVDLSDSINFCGSSDLIEYAIKRKWYKPKKDSVFNFRKAYSDEGNLENMGNIIRQWSAVNAVSKKQYETTDEFPFSFEPKKDIELSDLFKILRNHNEGTEYDGSDHYKNGHPHQFGRTICSNTTQYGFVAQLRSELPKDIAYVMWLAPFRPCVHPFTQWYFSMTEFPPGFNEGDFRKALEKHFDPIEDVFTYAPDHKFLEFVKHAKAVDENYQKSIGPLKNQIHKMESELIANQKEFEQKIMQQNRKDKRLTHKVITDYCKKQVENVQMLIR